MRLVHGNYEYAGFFYQIYDDENSNRVHAIAHDDQHPAARKQKHLFAAAECFDKEYGWSKRIPYSEYVKLVEEGLIGELD